MSLQEWPGRVISLAFLCMIFEFYIDFSHFRRLRGKKNQQQHLLLSCHHYIMQILTNKLKISVIYTAKLDLSSILFQINNNV